MPDQIVLRKETNLYDDEAIKAVRDSVTTVDNRVTSVDNKVTSQYATCSTPSSTAAKIAVVDGTFTLFKNARVSVYFSNANTTSSPTLNVAATGAKPIWAYGGPLSNTGNTFNWAAGATVEFVYDGSHWLVVDSSATKLVSSLDEKLNQEVIFNRLTNDGAIRGLFMQNNQMYINMDYLQTGTIKLGGANNGNGLMVVYDGSGAEIGRWDRNGISATGNLTIRYTVSSTGEVYSASAGRILLSSYNGSVYSYGLIVSRTQGSSGSDNIVINGTNGIQYSYVLTKIHGESYVYAPTIFEVYGTSLDGNNVHITGKIKDCGLEITGYRNNSTGFVFRVARDILQCYANGNYSSPILNIGPTSKISANSGAEIYATGDSGNSLQVDIKCAQGRLYFSNPYWNITGGSGGSSGRIAVQGSSSRRYKHNISDKINESLDAHKLYNLVMKQFIFNDNHELQYSDMRGKILPGFIAEDVAEIYPSAVIHNEKGEIENWDERRIIPAMLALIQEQNEKIKRLEKKLCM